MGGDWGGVHPRGRYFGCGRQSWLTALDDNYGVVLFPHIEQFAIQLWILLSSQDLPG